MDLGLGVSVTTTTQMQMAVVLKPVIVKPKRSQFDSTATQRQCPLFNFNYRPIHTPSPSSNILALRRRCSASSSSRGGGDPDSDAIILHVGGMMCEGCAANVKRILESRPQVSSATVNLASQIAIVSAVSQEKTAPNWQIQLGEALAHHLTSCGFSTTLPLPGQEDIR